MEGRQRIFRQSYRKRTRRFQKLILGAGFYLAVSGLLALFGIGTASLARVDLPTGIAGSHLEAGEFSPDPQHGRQLLQIKHKTTRLNCTPRSLDEFPGDFMSEASRKNGGVTVHILISLYIFGALALVCDDYFVASLERISDVLNLQPDVAGATFMAAGSSAPELFTSIIGLFLAKSDVGIGTIVGSAVFNILFIVAICGLFSGMVIYLTWWPMARDCIFYAASVIALIITIHDETVHWYEASIFIVMYILYIVTMYFNPRLGDYMTNLVTDWQMKKKLAKQYKDSTVYVSTEQSPLLEKKISYQSPVYIHDQEDIQDKHNSLQKSGTSQRGFGDTLSNSFKHSRDGTDAEFESPFAMPSTWFSRFVWILMLPISCLFILTIPDCRRPGCWRKTYILTFIMSVLWIAGLSYLMVWMVTIIGDTFNIPDTVMGLTLLAAGTSVPDALASLFVARDGYGDMAVSNTVGSNVFDILIGLGLPWLIQTGFVSPNSTVTINSSGLLYSVISLLGTIIFLLVTVFVNRWRLDRKLGVMCLIVYVIFVVLSCLYELNVFGQFTLPPCPRQTEQFW